MFFPIQVASHILHLVQYNQSKFVQFSFCSYFCFLLCCFCLVFIRFLDLFDIVNLIILLIAGNQGLGLLRLHSTYRHDLKIYASDEGRVQMTAAAFAKGLLALEGELTPILFQMVKSANTNGLLDNDGEASSLQHM